MIFHEIRVLFIQWIPNSLIVSNVTFVYFQSSTCLTFVFRELGQAYCPSQCQLKLFQLLNKKFCLFFTFMTQLGVNFDLFITQLGVNFDL